MAFKNNYFDTALADEGILGTPLEALARATFGQESSGGRNTATSYAGARGPMQVIPGTFKSVADPSWDINDPYANSRAGIRYLKQGWQASGGDPRLTAAYYYGGPGGMNKLANGIAVGDPRNPNAPNTAQYANQVTGRLGTSTNGNNMAILTEADPNQQPEYTANPILKQNPNAGIFERIANSPGLAEGLMGMGAGLLSATGSSSPLATGLSKGFTGFNAGYDQGIENAKARAVPIAGGAFTQITDAKGNVTVVPNKDAQDYLLRSIGARGQVARDTLQYKFDNQPLSGPEQRELKEIDQGILTAEKSLKDTADISTTLNDPKINDVLRQAGGLPFGQAIMGALGMDEAKLNQRLEGLKVDAWLSRSAALKGAISDAENQRLNAPMPKLTDSADVWKSFIEQRTRDLQSMKDGLQRIRETDYRKRPNGGGAPEQPKAPPAANPVAPPAPVETQPLPPIGGGNNDDPLGLNLKKR